MKEHSCSECGRLITSISGTVVEDRVLCSERCSDRAKVRRAFDERLIEVVMLGRRGQDHERALAILNELRDAWLDRDHDGWLDRSTRSHRAMILEGTGRYQEALDELRVVESRTAAWTHDYVLVKLSIARALESAGKQDEALEELRPVIAEWNRLPPLRVLDLLDVYTHIATSAGHTIDAAYSTIFEKWSTLVGIAVSSTLVATDLRAAIHDCSDQQEAGELRFSSLREQLKELSKEERANRILRYIDDEPITYLKERAHRLLDIDSKH